MKVIAEHLAAMRKVIEPLDNRVTREAYRAGKYPRSELTQDVNKRYRWDLYWAAKAYEVIPAVYFDHHIDTALRAIVDPL